MRTILLYILLSVSLVHCVKIGYRLDDIQDYWLTSCQKAVMDVFRSRNVPLTVGIIANGYGQDVSMVNYLNDSIFKFPSWELEIADHVNFNS